MTDGIHRTEEQQIERALELIKEGKEVSLAIWMTVKEDYYLAGSNQDAMWMACAVIKHLLKRAVLGTE